MFYQVSPGKWNEFWRYSHGDLSYCGTRPFPVPLRLVRKHRSPVYSMLQCFANKRSSNLYNFRLRAHILRFIIRWCYDGRIIVCDLKIINTIFWCGLLSLISIYHCYYCCYRPHITHGSIWFYTVARLFIARQLFNLPVQYTSLIIRDNTR